VRKAKGSHTDNRLDEKLTQTSQTKSSNHYRLSINFFKKCKKIPFAATIKRSETKTGRKREYVMISIMSIDMARKADING